MATNAYIDDVLSLAVRLGDSGLGPAVLDSAPAGGSDGVVTIDVRVYADELKPALAVQQALQLCVDAAALYADATAENRELDPDYTAAFVAERPVELLIIELGAGSFLARFSINPKTKAGRNRLIAIGGLATVGLVLTGVLAPLAVTAAGGLGYLNSALTPDAKPLAEMPLKTVDLAEAQDTQVEVEITGEGTAFAYEIQFSGSPDAIAAFLNWVGEINSVQPYEYAESESSQSELLRIWPVEPLDQGQTRAVAESLGIKVSQITAVRKPVDN
jgi:hypothetical protein